LISFIFYFSFNFLIFIKLDSKKLFQQMEQVRKMQIDIALEHAKISPLGNGKP